MIVTICGSIAFIDEMYQLKQQLEQLGFEVKLPPNTAMAPDGSEQSAKDMYNFKKTVPELDSPFWQHHSERIRSHLQKVAQGDVALIANYDKNGITNYIGPNTLIEMGLAFYLNKPIYLLQPVPDVHWKEEIIGMHPIVINGNLKLIKNA